LVSEDLFRNVKVYFQNACQKIILDDDVTLLNPDGAELRNYLRYIVTVDERGGLRIVDYLRWAELNTYMTVHEPSLTRTRQSGQGLNRYIYDHIHEGLIGGSS
jgi:predicted DNA-binding protein (UPF0251 family)